MFRRYLYYMKIIIKESQYQRLFTESVPEGTDLGKLSDTVNKAVSKMFKWCHTHATVKRRFPSDETITEYRHPFLELTGLLMETWALPQKESLILSYNFYTNFYNAEGNYDQFVGEELDWYGSFTYEGDLSLIGTDRATADGAIDVYGRNHNDAVLNIKNGNIYSEYYGDVSTSHESVRWEIDWDRLVDNGININDIEYS